MIWPLIISASISSSQHAATMKRMHENRGTYSITSGKTSTGTRGKFKQWSNESGKIFFCLGSETPKQCNDRVKDLK